jgi:hypothetical protein
MPSNHATDSAQCPFRIGDRVRFTPSARTVGLYQNVERFGVRVDEVHPIQSIKDGVYLYFDEGKGGWPWTEFTRESSAAS